MPIRNIYLQLKNYFYPLHFFSNISTSRTIISRKNWGNKKMKILAIYSFTELR